MSPIIQIWKVNPKDNEPIPADNLSSLDEVTTSLPGGLYTTFRTYDNGRRAIGFASHLKRLYLPCRELKIDAAIPADTLTLRIAELLPEDSESRVRLILSRAGDFYVIIEPLTPLNRKVYEQGVKVITLQGHRQLANLKLTGFIDESKIQREVVKTRGVFEGLLVQNGKILEGLTSNFFYICGWATGTARQGVLPGVTRKMVLEIIKESNLAVSFRALKLEELGGIDEAFITSSSRGIVPVVQIDEGRIGGGGVGNTTRLLIQRYEERVEQLAKPINPRPGRASQGRLDALYLD